MSHSITKHIARKFVSDLERVYRDEDGLSLSDQDKLAKHYREKIPGVDSFVTAMDQALRDDYITQTEWQTLAEQIEEPENRFFLEALQKKSWDHIRTRSIVTRLFEKKGPKPQYEDLSFFAEHREDLYLLLKHLRAVDLGRLDDGLRQDLLPWLLSVVEDFEANDYMAGLAVDVLKSCHDPSVINTLSTVLFQMKGMLKGRALGWNVGNVGNDGLHLLAVKVYGSLRRLDPERADSVWSLDNIAQDLARKKDAAPTWAKRYSSVEQDLILNLDVDTQIAILDDSNNRSLLTLTSEMTTILLERWAELTQEQKNHLITHPSTTVADRAYKIWAGEFRKNPVMKIDPELSVLARTHFLKETKSRRWPVEIEILAQSVRQDPGLRESLIDQPVIWQLWRVLDGNLDRSTLKDVLFLLENGPVGEVNIDLILGLLSQKDESVFLEVRKILLKSRQGLEGRLGALIREKIGMDPHAVRHALQVLELLLEFPETGTLSDETLETVRAVLTLANSSAREVVTAIRVLGLARDSEASEAIVVAVQRHEWDSEEVVREANEALISFGSAVFDVVEKELDHPPYCFGPYLLHIIARDKDRRDAFFTNLDRHDEVTLWLMIEKHLVAHLRLVGYVAELAEPLGRIIRDPESPLFIVEAATHALVAMNSKAVIPLLGDIFEHQRQKHPVNWIETLMQALALLGEAQNRDPFILDRLRLNAIQPGN